MRVVIAGGHGQIALRLTKLLAQRGDDVCSLIRNPAHADDVRAAGGTPVVCDLEECDVEDVAKAIRSADAFVFAAGAGPGSGAERKDTVDYGGAAKTIAASRALGIAHYVIVSASRADASAPGDDTFAAYLRAKGRADDELRSSGLNFTVVRPVTLTDDAGTGRVDAGATVGAREVTRDDVAAVVAAVLAEPSTIGITFDLSAGTTPIAEAVTRLAAPSAGP